MKSTHVLMMGLLAAIAAPAFAAFQVGDRVECNWKGGGKYYTGRVGAAEGEKLFINYNDGDKEHTSASMCRPLTVATGPMMEGSRVECRWKNGNVWYPGVIAEKTADQVFIHYNDGDKENTTLGKCRPR